MKKQAYNIWLLVILVMHELRSMKHVWQKCMESHYFHTTWSKPLSNCIFVFLPLWFHDNVWSQLTIGPSMSFYPDFILILSRFYSDFILILSRFYPDFIQILSWFYPDFILIFKKLTLSRFYPNFWKYLDKIRIKSG